MTTQFLISRCGPPDVPGTYPGSLDWDWAVAWPFAALAWPRSRVRMPALPARAADISSEVLGYWNSLAYLLTFSFGWTRHDRGLRWWYDAGKPTDDPRFALLDEVWERDESLARYAEFAWDRPNHVPPYLITSSNPSYLPPEKDDMDAEWTTRYREIAVGNPGKWGPQSTGYPHGLHLEMGTHLDGGDPGDDTGIKHFYEPDAPKDVTLILPGFRGWYQELMTVGDKLDVLQAPGARVKLFTRSNGFLGEYRRSWETGLWFAGQHRHHSVGN